MKGQQISPWSIYNQHLQDYPFIPDQLTTNPSPQQVLPKIRRRVSAVDYNQSDSNNNFAFKKKSKLVRSILEASKKRIEEKQSVEIIQSKTQSRQPAKQQEIDSKQLEREANELHTELQKYVVMSFIKHQLRSGREEQMFNYQFQAHSTHCPKALHAKARDNDLLRLPKIGSLKESILSTYQVGDQLDPQKEIDQQLLHELLKKKIESMISEKMKVRSHRKQLLKRQGLSSSNF